jgi:hypothetical protein
LLLADLLVKPRLPSQTVFSVARDDGLTSSLVLEESGHVDERVDMGFVILSNAHPQREQTGPTSRWHRVIVSKTGEGTVIVGR